MYRGPQILFLSGLSLVLLLLLLAHPTQAKIYFAAEQTNGTAVFSVERDSLYYWIGNGHYMNSTYCHCFMHQFREIIHASITPPPPQRSQLANMHLRVVGR